MNKKAVLFARVSTKKQEKNWTSLEEQIKHQTNFCKKNWWEIFWIFTQAFTGKKTWKELRQAVDFAKENKVDYFVIFDFDRFSREWYAEYQKLKEELFLAWISLKDSKEMIQETKFVFEDDLVDMKQYNWNRLNPSEILEVFFSTYAKAEWDKILQRTIPKEIKLEQQWYQVRQANYWLKNKKIQTPEWVWVIQIPDEMWHHLKEMFIARARWILTDKEIVDIANINWCKKRSWKPMDVKYMRELIENPIYAGIRIWKWTWEKPVIVPYEPLVDITIWNMANKWKKIIHKYENKVVIEENSNKRKKIEKVNTENFIFRGMIFYCGKAMRAYTTKNNVYYREWVWVKPPFNISQNNLFKILWEEIKNYSLPDELKKEMENGITKFLKKQYKNDDKLELSLEKELQKIKEETKEIAKKWAIWKISDFIMQEILEENEAKIKEIEMKIIEIKKQKVVLSHEAVELLKMLLNTRKLWESSTLEQKKLLIKMIWVELSFNDKKELKLAENKLFKLLRNINFSKWHPH